MTAEEDRKKIESGNHPFQFGRELIWFDRPEEISKSRSEMCGVRKKRGKPVDIPLRVVGTGRCGTTWLTKLLNKMGHAVGHECVRADGTISQFAHSDAVWYPTIPWATNFPGSKAHVGERMSDFRFAYTAHVVRHPLEAEASMRGAFNKMFFYWLQEVGVLTVPYDLKPSPMRNLYAWRDVTVMCCDLADDTFSFRRMVGADRVSIVSRMLTMSGLRSDEDFIVPELPPTNKSSGFKKHEPMEWAEVRSFDKDLYDSLRKLEKELKL